MPIQIKAKRDEFQPLDVRHFCLTRAWVSLAEMDPESVGKIGVVCTRQRLVSQPPCFSNDVEGVIEAHLICVQTPQERAAKVPAGARPFRIDGTAATIFGAWQRKGWFGSVDHVEAQVSGSCDLIWLQNAMAVEKPTAANAATVAELACLFLFRGHSFRAVGTKGPS